MKYHWIRGWAVEAKVALGWILVADVPQMPSNATYETGYHLMSDGGSN